MAHDLTALNTAPADTRTSLLLQRESCILEIKSIEIRLGLETCLITKQERHLLRRLRETPEAMRHVEELLRHPEELLRRPQDALWK